MIQIILKKLLCLLVNRVYDRIGYKMKRELIFLSYSVDPDPSRRGEVNVFEWIELNNSKNINSGKGCWLPQNK